MMDHSAVESSGCINLLGKGNESSWLQCLDLSCMQTPSGCGDARDNNTIETTSGEKSENYASRAEEEERKGNYRGASELYRKALRLDPQNARLHNNYGYLCSTHTHDYATAEYSYRQAIKCDPDYALSHNNLAFFLKKNKRDLAGAEHYYREAIRCDPDYAFAHSNLGVLLKAKKDISGAEAHYLAAIKANPNYAPAFLNYSLLLKNFDEKASWHYLNKAMEIDPSLRDSQAAQNLVRAFTRLGFNESSSNAPIEHRPRLAHVPIGTSPNAKVGNTKKQQFPSSSASSSQK